VQRFGTRLVRCWRRSGRALVCAADRVDTSACRRGQGRRMQWCWRVTGRSGRWRGRRAATMVRL
jgi:hypothetical protein